MKTNKFSLLSWLGMWLRSPSRRRSAADEASTDRRTALYNRGGLLAHGKAMLADCRAAGRELTLAVFECSDIVEARKLYGDRTSRKLIDDIVLNLTLLAGPGGLAARTGPTQFAVALPMPRERAVQQIERLLGNPARFELEGCSTEIVLVPNLMVEEVPAAGTVEGMYAALCRGLVRVQEEERMRNEHLQRQRERHSRPMPESPRETVAERPARPARPVLDPDPVMVHQIPTTIPMPLSTR